MTEVSVHGPVFDGRFGAQAVELVDDIRHHVASQALAYWMTNLDRSIQHPTPYYETQINIHSVAGESVVNDRGVVYGPWLEGTGSRNFPRTRFPGYHSARNATNQLVERIPELIQPLVEAFVEKINDE